MKSDSREFKTQNLLQRAQSGDEAAFDALLSVSREHLLRIVKSQIGQRLQGEADSSDLVQEALLEVHRQFKRFRGTTEGEYGVWLRTILAGLVANHIRRFLGTKKRDARLEQAIVSEMNDSSCAVDIQLAASIGTPSEVAVRNESSWRLTSALEALPEHYRQVIVLRHLDGLPFSQVADRMGRTVASVEKLWMRALSRLRDQMDESK